MYEWVKALHIFAVVRSGLRPIRRARRPLTMGQDFGADRARRSPSSYRIVGALPVATLAAVVVLVAVKPF